MLPPSFRYFLRNHYQRRPALTVGCTPGVYALSGEGFRELHIFFAPRSRRPPRPTRPPDEFNIGFECLFLRLRQHQGRSRGFDGAVGAFRSRGSARDCRRLSSLRRRDGRPVCRVCRQIHGRRRPRRLPAGEWGRPGARGPGGLGGRRRGPRPQPIASLEIQTNWTRIPHIPSMITVATSPATTAPPTMNRSANALVTPCAIMTPRAPPARWARTKNAASQ